GLKKSWLSLIRALYIIGYYDEAASQIRESEQFIDQSVDFLYYEALVLFAKGKSKDAMIILEDALQEAPRKIKIIEELQPDLLHRNAIIDLIATYKKPKK